MPGNVREIISIPRPERTPAQTQTVFSYWRTTIPDWKEANQQIAQLWKEHPEGTSQLEGNSGSARADARLLLAHILKIDAATLFARGDAAICPSDANAFFKLVEARASGMPVAYLLGTWGFYGRESNGGIPHGSF